MHRIGLTLVAASLVVAIAAFWATAPNHSLRPDIMRAEASTASNVDVSGLQFAVMIAKGATVFGTCSGDTTTYSVTFTNNSDPGTGNRSATISDLIPTNTTFVNASVTGGATYIAVTNRVVWSGSLAPGGSVTIGFDVTMNSSVANGTNIANDAIGVLATDFGPLQAQLNPPGVKFMVNCPTPTPTVTDTPAMTPTHTPTNTSTPTITPTPTLTPMPTKQPAPGDTDGDGCTDQSENGPDETVGGRRDFRNFWDFYDPNQDGSVTTPDLLTLIQRFAAVGDPNIHPLSAPPPAPAYHTRFDRGGVVGANPWNLGPPNGAITVTDFFTMLAQFGHTCT